MATGIIQQATSAAVDAIEPTARLWGRALSRLMLSAGVLVLAGTAAVFGVVVLTIALAMWAAEQAVDARAWAIASGIPFGIAMILGITGWLLFARANELWRTPMLAPNPGTSTSRSQPEPAPTPAPEAKADNSSLGDRLVSAAAKDPALTASLAFAAITLIGPLRLIGLAGRAVGAMSMLSMVKNSISSSPAPPAPARSANRPLRQELRANQN